MTHKRLYSVYTPDRGAATAEVDAALDRALYRSAVLAGEVKEQQDIIRDAQRKLTEAEAMQRSCQDWIVEWAYHLAGKDGCPRTT